MEKDKFLNMAQEVINNMQKDPIIGYYLQETQNCLLLLNIFQFITIGIIILLAARFKTFGQDEGLKINKSLLIASGLLLIGMIVCEVLKYDCMNRGFYGTPIGLQLVILLAVGYFYFCKKG